tara:strand:- start:875 stop:1399 length:525 start_codon:yes stop_codon:yes gene_type:complete
MSAINIIKPNNYVFVNDKNTNQIMHFKCKVLSEDCNTVKTAMTIPVFNSLSLMKEFQTQILEKNTMDKSCYVYVDNNHDCIASTRLSTKSSTYDTKIEEYYPLNPDYVERLMIHKVGLFIINNFAIEDKSIYDLSDEKPLILTGDIWIPSITISDNCYFREITNDIYDNLYLNS